MKNLYIRLSSLGLAISYVALTVILPTGAIAAPKEQETLKNKGIYYYEPGCTVAASSQADSGKPGTGAPDGATFPKLDPASMASAINTYIDKVNKDSGLAGLGETIVASAEKANVSPFLIVAIAQKESSLANPSDYNVRKANNAFGRTATSSQPHFQGARPWYKWSSVKASVDYTAAENKDASGGGDIAAYIREVYAKQLDSGNISEFFKKYAPEFENDTAKYISDVGKGVDEMVSLAKGGATTTDPTTSPDQANPDANNCCVTAPAAGDISTSGSNNEEKVWNFLTGDLKFTPNQAAGVMGNIKQESGFSPTIVNPSSGAYGLAQWYAGRKTALQSYASSKGKPVNSLAIQLEFLKKELEGSYKSSVLDPIKAKDSIENTTLVWLERFEVPCLPGSCGGEMAKRLPFAEAFLKKYGGQAGSTAAINADTPPEGSCQEAANKQGSGAATGEFMWPIKSSGNIGMIYSCYGNARGRLHTGIDISAPVGTTIVAADGGTVIAAGNIDPAGFGNTIIIEHPSGKFTLYAHLSVIIAKKGDKVDQGQIIAKSGGLAGAAGSGSSLGPHLHFNVQKKPGAGKDTINPLKVLPKDGRAVNTGGGDCPPTPTFI